MRTTERLTATESTFERMKADERAVVLSRFCGYGGWTMIEYDGGDNVISARTFACDVAACYEDRARVVKVEIFFPRTHRTSRSIGVVAGSDRIPPHGKTYRDGDALVSVTHDLEIVDRRVV